MLLKDTASMPGTFLDAFIAGQFFEKIIRGPFFFVYLLPLILPRPARTFFFALRSICCGIIFSSSAATDLVLFMFSKSSTNITGFVAAIADFIANIRSLAFILCSHIFDALGGCALLPFTACGAILDRHAMYPTLPCILGILDISMFIILNL